MKVVIAVVVVAILGVVVWTQFMGSGAVATPAVETASETEAERMEDMDNMEGMNDANNADAEDTTILDVDTDVTADASAELDAETVKEFTVDSFGFGYSMDTIEVNEGDTVTINLTNSDGVHDWVVDEFDAATDIIRAGETTSVTFVADAAGTYEYYCSVGNHRAQGMVGTLVVR